VSGKFSVSHSSSDELVSSPVRSMMADDDGAVDEDEAVADDDA
jgi:hypothetical protein